MWTVTVVEYQDAMRAAIYGIEDLFGIANRFSPEPIFKVEHLCVKSLDSFQDDRAHHQRLIFLPPAVPIRYQTLNKMS
ncbi:hypothetical protein [Vibrio mexicanus]|uniref:hypothetical protein n=1 Tax=Vibrio mexicanus TaxID=1004326 RepID=UPI0012FC8384|nr:hypothetical protein [Vibrio mexicanus]